MQIIEEKSAVHHYPDAAILKSCKKISSFAVSEASLALSLAIVRPATEKPRFEGADVAGMPSNLTAKIDSSLYFYSLYPPGQRAVECPIILLQLKCWLLLVQFKFCISVIFFSRLLLDLFMGCRHLFWVLLLLLLLFMWIYMSYFHCCNFNDGLPYVIMDDFFICI